MVDVSNATWLFAGLSVSEGSQRTSDMYTLHRKKCPFKKEYTTLYFTNNHLDLINTDDIFNLQNINEYKSYG